MYAEESPPIIKKKVHPKVIRRDIARTYPEHDFFKRREEEGREAPGQVR